MIALAQQMAESVGCAGVVVEANPEAAAFYRWLGFVQLALVSGVAWAGRRARSESE
jgi:hypothetical protein